MRDFKVSYVTNYSYGDEIKPDETRGPSSTWVGEKMLTEFWWGKLKESCGLEDQSVCKMMILISA